MVAVAALRAQIAALEQRLAEAEEGRTELAALASRVAEMERAGRTAGDAAGMETRGGSQPLAQGVQMALEGVVRAQMEAEEALRACERDVEESTELQRRLESLADGPESAAVAEGIQQELQERDAFVRAKEKAAAAARPFHCERNDKTEDLLLTATNAVVFAAFRETWQHDGRYFSACSYVETFARAFQHWAAKEAKDALGSSPPRALWLRQRLGDAALAEELC